MRRFYILICIAAAFSLVAAEAGPTGRRSAEAPWPMHPVDDRFRGANGLGPGDVNRDGFIDYVTNYEFDQRYVISFHPGSHERAKGPWPTVVAWKPEPLKNGKGVNPEHSALGDFDGDGNLDLVTAQGWSSLAFWEGSQPGVRIVWGPPPERALHEEAWVDAGRIPATIDRGHLIFVVPRDVDEDGALDIVSGGRTHGGNNRKGGVIWIQAPSGKSGRRDLSKWQVHDIDPDQFSAHGLVLADVDQDGDKDIVLANADLDTPEEEEKLLWYEDPGPGSAAQKDPWPKHVVYEGSEFFAKPQVAVADLDGDGLLDLITQTSCCIYYFRKTGLDPVTWEKIVIEKDPVAQWRARPVRVADLNGDGRQDIIGMLIHEGGELPGDKAAAFWMEYRGDGPREDNWTTHVIKRGSGRTMVLPIFGEKWDQVNVVDLDRDGDPDLIANCEEWWIDDIEFRFFWDPRVDPQSVSVVWFENRLNEGPYVYEERGGVCAIEAEDYTRLADGTWVIRSRYEGYSGSGYVQDHNRLHMKNRAWDDSEGLSYDVRLEGGAYHLWLRCLAPGEWGCLGGRQSDSAWISVDREEPEQPLRCKGSQHGRWAWTRSPELLEIEPGTHTFTVRAREGGFSLDRIILSKDPGFKPRD